MRWGKSSAGEGHPTAFWGGLPSLHPLPQHWAGTFTGSSCWIPCGVPVPPLQAAGPGLCRVRHLWQAEIKI